VSKESSDELDTEIFRHFDELPTESAPAFEQVWRRAQSQVASTPGHLRRNWVPLATAATAILVVMLVINSSSVVDRSPVQIVEADPDAVFKELIVTTRWRAPSDELMNGQSTLRAWDVPQFDWLNNFDSEKS
jgi:hypothetical protein